MSKPTEGEWEAHGTMVVTPPNAEVRRRVAAEDFPITSRKICVCADGHYVPTAEAEANARLIAASPELLAASEDALSAIKELMQSLPGIATGGLDDAALGLEAAVAKARGTTP